MTSGNPWIIPNLGAVSLVAGAQMVPWYGFVPAGTHGQKSKVSSNSKCWLLVGQEILCPVLVYLKATQFYSINVTPVTRVHLTVSYDLPHFLLPPSLLLLPPPSSSSSFPPPPLSYPCLFPPSSQPPIAAAKDRSPVARPSPSMPKTPVEGVGILRISGYINTLVGNET